MGINEFTELVVMALGDILEIPLEVKEVIKENDMRHTGIQFGDGDIRPVFYMDEYYNRYLNDGVSPREAAEELALHYEEVKDPDLAGFNPFKDLSSIDKVRNRIRVAVVLLLTQ